MARVLLNDIWRLRQMNDPPLSQRDLARLLGVDRKDLGRWERGEVTPSLEMAAKIAAALHVPVETLFFETFERAHDEALRRESLAGMPPVRRRVFKDRAPWSPKK